MKFLLIFDFNRTIFDPEKQKLVARARALLRTLHERGHTLCLVAQAAPSREKLIENLGIGQYFSQIFLVYEKKKKDFEKLIFDFGFLPEKTFVLGDRIQKEIRVGNLIGCQTIWIKSGKFRTEIPKNNDEIPNFTVSKLTDILKIIP